MGGSESVFDAKQRLLETLGWAENPFVKDLRISEKDTFMKHYCPLDGGKVLQSLAFDAKACVLEGPKGVGKTSALYFAYYSLPSKEFYPVMLKEPPASLEQLGEETGLFAQKNLVQKIFYAIGGGRKVSRRQLVQRIRSVNKKVVLFVDEAHLGKDEMQMEFKYLLDEVPNLRMVFSALGTGSFPDSLLHLVGDRHVFQRKDFSKEEMRKIIRHRIEAVGGTGLAPFSETALESVLTEQNLFSPRYVFDELNSLLAKMALGEKTMFSARGERGGEKEGGARQEKTANKEALAKKERSEKIVFVEKSQKILEEKNQNNFENNLIANEEMEAKAGREFDNELKLEEHEEEEGVLGVADPIVLSATARGRQLNTSNADWWVLLTPSQQQIMQLLVAQGREMSLAEVCKATALGESTVFNCLYQLRGEDEKEIERKKEVPFPLVQVEPKMVGGKKKNVYKAAPKVRSLFTMH